MSGHGPWVLGIAASHNGAACLLRGDEIVVAIQEERLLRSKRARLHGAFGHLAISYCLDYARLSPADLAMIVLCSQASNYHADNDVFLNDLLQPSRFGVPVRRISHHTGHAAGAFATSGFEEAAVLVVDGMGSPYEDLSEAERQVIRPAKEKGAETHSLYGAVGTELRPLEKQVVKDDRWLDFGARDRMRTGMPRFGSLGGLYGAVGWQIFGDTMDGAGKVMGLAPYGRATIPASDFFSVEQGVLRFSDEVPGRYAHAEHWPARQQEYRDLAASAQAALEEAVLACARRLRELCPSARLCYAGGVALNSVANERIIREAGFKEVFIMPAAEDSGTAIGAAYYGLWQLTGRNSCRRLAHDAVGRTYVAREIAAAIASAPAVVARRSDDVIEETVTQLCAGRIVGWFQGRSELGPRALGQRSILCDPRRPEMKDVLNSRVKHREGFRPFAPMILLDEAASWFDLDGAPRDSPFMLRIARFRPEKQSLVPAVVHVDGTGRMQTVTREANGFLYDLLREFHRRTGVPILLNTSFNVAGEPIVETPDDALWCLLYTGLDRCVLGDHIVEKRPQFRSILDLRVRLSGTWASVHYPVGTEGIDGVAFEQSAALPVETPVGAITAASLMLRQRIDALKLPFAEYRVMTPWGEATQFTELKIFELLRLVDGRRTGAMLHQLLAATPGAALDEPSFMRLLGRLRRAAIISFHEA